MSKIRTLSDWLQGQVRSLGGAVKRNWVLALTVSLTVLYFALILVPRGGDVWSFVRDERLNESGDFLAGVLTPVALMWLIAGYFLQREELRAQREELGLQREELKRTGDALAKQTEIDEKRLEDERRQMKPRFTLEGKGIVGSDRRFVLHNGGGNAYDITVRYGLMDYGKKLTPEGTIIERMIEQGGDFSFSIPNPPSSCVYSFQVDSPLRRRP